MKPKWYELIPFYGFIKYFRRYFDAEKRGYKEAIQAEWMHFYHTLAATLVMILTFFAIKTLIQIE